MSQSTRFCNGCERDMALEDFPRNRNSPGGRDRRCKTCHRDRMRARRYARANGLPMPSIAKPKAPAVAKPKRPSRPPKEAAEINLYNIYRAGARKRGYSFELTLEQCVDIFYRPCVICGREEANSQVYAQGRPGEYRISYTGIDRIDNAQGYVVENVQPMCGVCNKAKAALGQEDFAGWIAAVKANA